MQPQPNETEAEQERRFRAEIDENNRRRAARPKKKVLRDPVMSLYHDVFQHMEPSGILAFADALMERNEHVEFALAVRKVYQDRDESPIKEWGVKTKHHICLETGRRVARFGEYDDFDADEVCYSLCPVVSPEMPDYLVERQIEYFYRFKNHSWYVQRGPYRDRYFSYAGGSTPIRFHDVPLELLQQTILFHGTVRS